jgi:hypothetical protein
MIKMETSSNETLYNACINSEKKIITQSENKYTLCCCCITNKWCFQHTGLTAVKDYDNTANNYCICLDCCTWCLEFRTRKYDICEKPIICYLCCCSIYLKD